MPAVAINEEVPKSPAHDEEAEGQPAWPADFDQYEVPYNYDNELPDGEELIERRKEWEGE
jgi:hypothetical protein